MRSLTKALARRVDNAAPIVPVGERPPVPLTGSGKLRTGMGVLTGQYGSDANRNTKQYGKSTPLFSAVSLNAEGVAQVPWRLYQANAGRGRISGPDPRTEVPDHAAKRLIDRPNRIMHGQFFREYGQTLIELTGLLYILVTQVAGVPTTMWPVKRNRIIPIPDERDYLAGYAYVCDDGSFIPLQFDEVIPIQTVDPDDPLGGMAPATPLTTDLDAANMTSEFRRNFFKNSAQPGGIVQLDLEANLHPKDFAELTERWSEQHRGVRNAHRVAFLERGQWVSNDTSLKDMQFTQMRQDDRNAIYEGYRAPKSLIGVTEDVNRANAEAAEYVWTKWALTGKLARWKAAWNFWLLPMYGSAADGRLAFDHDNIVPDDWQADAVTTATNFHAAAEAVAAGWHPDDVLASLSMPAMRYVGPPGPNKQTPVTDPQQARANLHELMAAGAAPREAVQQLLDALHTWGAM